MSSDIDTDCHQRDEILPPERIVLQRDIVVLKIVVVIVVVIGIAIVLVDDVLPIKVVGKGMPLLLVLFGIGHLRLSGAAGSLLPAPGCARQCHNLMAPRVLETATEDGKGGSLIVAGSRLDRPQFYSALESS